MTPTHTMLMALFLLLFHAGNATAQPQHSFSNDCSQISVDYENRANLTQQERIELMDQALLRSLNKYEGCQNMQKNTAAGGGAAGGQAGAENSNADDGSGSSGKGAASGTSTASTSMTGSETPAEQTMTNDDGSDTNAGSGKSDKAASQITDATDEQAGVMNQQANKRIKGSGRVPGDIPPVDNDSILEAQIRQAAMSETDPAIKAQLWNEYRKYKSLPLKQP
ncbi:MAG: hypothetical protein Q9M16_02950 [Mariprofundus sp.]|nr:hypothetical protein [Mariprofundus sp.]